MRKVYKKGEISSMPYKISKDFPEIDINSVTMFYGEKTLFSINGLYLAFTDKEVLYAGRDKKIFNVNEINNIYIVVKSSYKDIADLKIKYKNEEYFINVCSLLDEQKTIAKIFTNNYLIPYTIISNKTEETNSKEEYMPQNNNNITIDKNARKEQTFTDEQLNKMSVEELREQIEKQKLINELKHLQENKVSNYSKTTVQSKNAYNSVSDTISTEKIKNIKKCPKCKSTHIELVDDDVKEYKSTTSLNVNPLKPLTVFNHKEKEKKKKVRSKGKVAAAIMTGGASLLVTGGTKTTVHKKFVCKNCYHSWYEK